MTRAFIGRAGHYEKQRNPPFGSARGSWKCKVCGFPIVWTRTAAPKGSTLTGARLDAATFRRHVDEQISAHLQRHA